MPTILRDETIYSTWKEFFENDYKSEIETLATAYPEKRSIYVDYDRIDKKNPELAEKLLEEPYKYLFNAEETFKEIDTVVGHIKPHIRFINLPDISKKSIRDLRSEHVGKFVSIEGLVKKDTTIRANIKIAAFQCQKCGAIIKVEQDEEILTKVAYSLFYE